MGRANVSIKKDGTIVLTKEGDVETYQSIDDVPKGDAEIVFSAVEPIVTERKSHTVSTDGFKGTPPKEWSGLYYHFIEDLERRGKRDMFDKRLEEGRFSMKLTVWVINRDEVNRLPPSMKENFLRILSTGYDQEARSFDDLYPVRFLQISLGDVTVKVPDTEMSSQMRDEFDLVMSFLDRQGKYSNGLKTQTGSDDVYQWKGMKYTSIHDIPDPEGREYFRRMVKERGFPNAGKGPTVCMACGQRGSIKKTLLGKWKCPMCNHKWTT